MEPEGSLPCLQERVTGPEQDESSPYSHFISPISILILSSHLHLGVFG
jgi:hypothetical protein